MFRWEVEYLDCFGVCSVHDVVEDFYAFTKFGVWRQFLRKHKGNIPNSYTDRSHFTNFIGFKEMVTFKGF